MPLHASGGDKAKARDFVKALYGNVKILDTGRARVNDHVC